MTDHISDERIAEIEAIGTTCFGFRWADDTSLWIGLSGEMLTLGELRGLIARLRAAEARLANATRFKPDPECSLCKGRGRVEYWCHDDIHHRDCECTYPCYAKGGGK